MKPRNPKPMKKFSQVFLDRPETLEKFAQQIQNLGYGHAVEIGPGPGFLTRHLLNKEIEVTAYELDTRMVDHLKELFSEEISKDNLQIFLQDILNVNHTEESSYPQNAALIGNIPYGISSGIIQWALSPQSRFQDMFFMVQKEFGERLASPTGLKSYGSLSVFAQARADVEILEFIPKEWFDPVPKVDSVFIHLKKNRKADEFILKKSEMVSKILFHQRRKKIRNGIKALCSTYKVPIENIPADMNKRPEELSAEEFIEIAGLFNEAKKNS